MRRLHRFLGGAFLAILVSGFLGCQTTENTSSGTAPSAPGANAGTLTISRAPNLSEALVVTVDGGAPLVVSSGDTFNRSLSPGQHVVSAILQPNQLNLAPTKLNLNVEKGKNYAYTAMWQGDTLVLQP